MESPEIALSRLRDVPVADVVRLLNEPRNARHMPLVGEPFTERSAEQWVAAKDDQWVQHGYGPWAITVGGTFAGWGGFQAEEDGADLGLVLLPGYRGLGAAIAHRMLDTGFDVLGLEVVLVALPFSRSNPDGAVARWGFHAAGVAELGGVRFRRYRLERTTWYRIRETVAPRV